MVEERRPPNRLLESLPEDAYARIAPYMRSVSLRSGELLHRAGESIRYLFFPLDCLISITVTMRDARTAETGVVGRREVVGINAFMGGRETTQTEYVVQVAGEAVRVPARPLRDEFDTNLVLRDVLLRFTQAMFAQVAQNAACSSLHTLEYRFARWLLEVRDRIASDDLRITHGFVAQMLGVRRAGVTVIAGRFEAMGLIEHSRGHIRILDIALLEAAACECYGVVRDEYDRLLIAERAPVSLPRVRVPSREAV